MSAIQQHAPLLCDFHWRDDELFVIVPSQVTWAKFAASHRRLGRQRHSFGHPVLHKFATDSLRNLFEILNNVFDEIPSKRSGEGFVLTAKVKEHIQREIMGTSAGVAPVDVLTKSKAFVNVRDIAVSEVRPADDDISLLARLHYV